MSQIQLSNNGIQSFWKKPDSMSLKLVLGAGLIWAVLNLSAVLLFFTSLIKLAFLGGFVAVVVMFWDRIWPFIQFVFSQITSLVYEIRPDKIAQFAIDDAKAKNATVLTQATSLRNQARELGNQIVAKQRSMKSEADNAMKVGEVSPMFATHVNQVGRLKRTVEKLSRLQVLSTELSKALDTLHTVNEATIIDRQNELNEAVYEWNTVRKANSGISIALGILGGNTGVFNYRRAMDTIADQISRNKVEIESKLQTVNTFLERIDLVNGEYDQAGLQQIQEQFGIQVQAAIPRDTTINIDELQKILAS